MAVPSIPESIPLTPPRRRNGSYWFDIVFGRLVPAIFFSVFLVDKALLVQGSLAELGSHRQASDYLAALNQVLGLVYFTMLVVLYVVRLPKRAGDGRPLIILASFFGSFSVILASFLPGVAVRPNLQALSTAMVLVGLGYTVWSLGYLRRSFSIMPEARRLVTGGPYGLSRHPLYLGEGLAAIGLNIPTVALPGMLVLAAFLVAQYIRIRAEERVLEREFPEYAAYRRRVPRYLPTPASIAHAPALTALSRRLTPRTLLLGGIMLALLAAFTSTQADPDYWWHLRIGQWMLSNGLPRHDLFTYTVPDHAWTDHEYATEILMAVVAGGGGLAAVSLGFGLLTWAGFWLIYLAVQPYRPPYVIAALGLALGALAGAPIWGPRAQMITFFLACLELYWIRGYLAGRSRALNWFPLVMVLWANLHGGWAVAFVFLGVAFAAEALKLIADRRDPAARAHVRRLALIGVASLAAVLATPHGPSLLLYPLVTQGSAAQQSLIVEWFSPNFHRNDLKPFELMMMLLIAGFAIRRPSLYDLLLALAVLALALQSVRHIVLFVAAATPILILTWSDVWRRVTAARGWRPGTSEARPLFAAITGAALVVIAAASAGVIASHLRTQDQVIRTEYPVGAADWLAANPGVGTRMFNQYGYGGYLVDRFYPDPNRRVFVFGEAELMGDDLLLRYQDVASLRADWKRVLDDYRVDYVVFNRGEALSNVLATDADWTRVYQDAYTEIYVRR